jgi:hypothetical protein
MIDDHQQQDQPPHPNRDQSVPKRPSSSPTREWTRRFGIQAWHTLGIFPKGVPDGFANLWLHWLRFEENSHT